MAISGDYAYVADRHGGLRIIDVSDPADPTETGFYDTPGSAEAIAVSGNYAYVADDIASGLRVIDVSNPATPTETGHLNTPGYAWDVAVVGNYTYVADRESGL